MTGKTAMWKVVAARGNGNFIYAVRTTGIYCRPGCSSRLPQPAHVEFYPHAAAAKRAGYRPCKRCAPDSLHSSVPSFIIEACNLLQQAAAAGDTTDNLPALAERAGLSVRHFHRLFKKHAGITPLQYAQAERARRWRTELGKKKSVTDAIYEAGFQSSGRAYENPAASLGMTPGAYQNGGAGMQVFHAIVKTSLGYLLVAATARGICAMEFGRSQKMLKARLRERFPRAEMADGTAAFKRQLARAAAAAEVGGRRATGLPLDIRGTAFQVKVWRALRQIPAGQTTTYSALAKQIGKPRAARAVAAACAANPAAVAVPCHRVIGKDGDLRGYRWGLERKKTLLQAEGALPPKRQGG